MKVLTFNLILALVMTVIVSNVHAGTARIVDATVTRIINTNGATYGGCLVRLSISPSTELPNCGWGYLTFSCDGTHTNITNAMNMFESAKMAFALDKKVSVDFTDAYGHNGYCFATRIDVY